jgi:hypothetical protein
MIKMKKLALLGLTVLFVSCAPTLLGSKEWVRITMIPTREERVTACDRGFSAGAALNFNALLAGVADLPAPKGDLTFFSALGGTYSLCYLFGVAKRPVTELPSGPTFITYTPETGETPPKIFVVLKDENGKDLGKIDPSDTQTEKGDIYYGFRRFSGADLDLMGKSSYLEVAVVQNEKEARYKVTREMFGAPLQAKIPDVFTEK